MEIKGKKVLITGATGKLGSKIAITLAQKGAECICHYNRSAEPAQRLVEQIENAGGKATAVNCDFSLLEDPAQLLEPVPQILINSASVFQPDSDLDEDTAAMMMRINAEAPQKLSIEFAKAAEASHSRAYPLGKIINLTDIAPHLDWPSYKIYADSKKRLLRDTVENAVALAPAITVNAISPGLIDIPDDISTEQIDELISKIPMRRQGSYEDIISAVVFLIENDYITGQELIVDGGRTIAHR